MPRIPLFAASALLLAGLSDARAEQLPIRAYTPAEGLPRNHVSQIIRDAHGFLWFATPEGLSRFDGYGFTTYGAAQGLSSEVVTDLRETSDGTLWVATEDGLDRFHPGAIGPRFSAFYPGREKKERFITALCEDHARRLWCGTRAGLFLVESDPSGAASFRRLDLPVPNRTPLDRIVTAIYADPRGVLWVGMGQDVYRIRDGESPERHEIPGADPLNVITQFLEDRAGTLWMSSRGGLYRLVEAPAPGRSIVRSKCSRADGLANDWVNGLLETSDGRLFAGTTAGLSQLLSRSTAERAVFRTFTSQNGLTDDTISALAEDREGNLWLGTENAGAMKVARSGFTTYTAADGLTGTHCVSFLESRDGEPCAVIVLGTEPTIQCFDGARFHAVRPDYGRPIANYGWGWYQTILQDRGGEWWAPTGNGLFRFPRTATVQELARTLPNAVYGMENGLSSEEAFRLYEDSKGDVWIAPITLSRNWISRFERSTGRFHHYTDSDGVPPGWPTAFREAPEGTIWVGFYQGLLTRCRGGRFEVLGASEGVPGSLGIVQAILRDHAGRLWVGTDGGLLRTDDPAADHPRFAVYRAAEGLSGDGVCCLAEDGFGRIYVATGRGVDRIEPRAMDGPIGPIRHYTTADGLARSELSAAFSDASGALWFGSRAGLSRLVPAADAPRSPPPVLVSALRIRGEPYPISQLGETELTGIRLEPQQNQIQIDFLGLSFAPGETLRYQVRLLGADDSWSAPTEHRTVNYASLAPGSYRFEVRAVAANGDTSPKPAAIGFRVVPPVWKRSWFRFLACALAGAGVYALHRARVARLVELERVRTRIATDLHDDIGSSLSKIAILSEVATRESGGGDRRLAEPLSQIAGASRELVASMSDIVWAINPQHDHLQDLTQRMRRFASDLLTASDIELDFRIEGEKELKLGADVRREIFLIFKEAIHNAVRHSGCGRIGVALSAEGGRLVLRIVDDGNGFDLPANPSGHGLHSMRLRAQRIGGELAIVSAPSRGTRIELLAPVRRPSQYPLSRG